MDPTSVADVLREVDDKPASYLAAARRLAQVPHGDLTPVRVVALASFTFELAIPYLVVECARRGLYAGVTAAPFGQLEQQVLDPASALWAARPDIVIVATRIEDLAAALGDDFLTAPVASTIDAYVMRLAELVRAIRARGVSRVAVWNQPPPRRLAAGVADACLDDSQQQAIADVDRKLARAVAAIPGAAVVDIARVATELGTRQWYDAKLAALARMPLSVAAQIAAARATARVMRAMSRPAAKCLVLDLDNTLWGGVLGEDGVGGIALGEEHPGSAFKAFQRAVRSYRDRGVLLAIASKNNEADVAEVFASHGDMVLTRADFAAVQIHWNDKATSLRAIAEELNIGIDSLVFFDDSPVERAWVREQLPEVTVLDVPTDPLAYIDALDASGVFDQLTITAEDRARTGMYRGETLRKRDLERTAGSLDEFLRALQMKIDDRSDRCDDAAACRAAARQDEPVQRHDATTRRGRAGGPRRARRRHRVVDARRGPLW